MVDNYFFKNNCKCSSTRTNFGLIDNMPAKISENTIDEWIAEIKNLNQNEILFFALDNCLEILNNEEPESLCDGFLFYNNLLIFVELKDRTYSGWLSSGNNQLINTYKIFKLMYNKNDFMELSFVIANKQRPFATSNHQKEIQRFFDETNGAFLEIKTKIKL